MSVVDSTGEGLYYIGSLVYRWFSGFAQLESAGFGEGRFVPCTGSGSGYIPQYYFRDHLGSVRAIYDSESRVITERNDYMCYGFRSRDYATTGNRYRYNGKEDQSFMCVPYHDFGSRMYDPEFRLGWNTMDRKSEQYYSLSPYCFCAGNPVKYVDPNGEQWAYYSIDGVADPTWNWVDEDEYHTGRFRKDGSEIVLPAYQTVVVFNGSYNETLGKGDNLYGEGAILADVTVYGVQGADDIQLFKGYTMSSDPSRYGVVDNGTYTVNRLSGGDKLGPYRSDLTLNNRGRVDALNNYNPAYPSRNPAYLNGVFIHRANNNGWAGAKYDVKRGKYVAVSEGCLLISPNHWNSFQSSVKHTNQFLLQINRR